MGYDVYMDENGDAEGNYSLVSLCEVNLWRRKIKPEYALKGSWNVTKKGSS